MSDISYPIIDSTDRVNVAGVDDYDPTANRIVGILVANIYWRTMLRGRCCALRTSTSTMICRVVPR
jgi:hypothetical protein